MEKKEGGGDGGGDGGGVSGGKPGGIDGGGGGDGGGGISTTRLVIWKAESMMPLVVLAASQAAATDGASRVRKSPTYRPSTRMGVLLALLMVYPTIFVRPVSCTAQM